MQDLVRSDYNRTSANFQDLDICRIDGDIILQNPYFNFDTWVSQRLPSARCVVVIFFSFADWRNRGSTNKVLVLTQVCS